MEEVGRRVVTLLGIKQAPEPQALHTQYLTGVCPSLIKHIIAELTAMSARRAFTLAATPANSGVDVAGVVVVGVAVVYCSLSAGGAPAPRGRLGDHGLRAQAPLY